MNNLKKALGKDDLKKYQKKNVTTSFKKEVKWNNIDNLIECRSIYKKNLQLTLQNHYSLIIQKGFESGQLRDFPEILSCLIQKFLEYSQGKNLTRIMILEKICQEIYEMMEDEKSTIMKRYFQITLQKIQKVLLEEKKTEKEANLKEFEKLVNILKPSTKKKQKNNFGSVEKQKLHKLGNSISGNNLKIKVTQEQFQIKGQLKKKKSQGNLNSVYNSSGHIKNTSQDYKGKLQALLKQPNIKLVKTKIQYDYSAILEASKANIQKRNKTHNLDTEKQTKKKINELKKDEAFIFYRPKK